MIMVIVVIVIVIIVIIILFFLLLIYEHVILTTIIDDRVNLDLGVCIGIDIKIDKIICRNGSRTQTQYVTLFFYIAIATCRRWGSNC